MKWPFRTPRLTLLLIHWHFVQIFITAANWRFFVSKEESLLGVDIPRTHLAFNIIGVLAFLFVGSLFIYWPYKYGLYMLRKSRRNKIMFGTVVIYFTHVLPCWMMEFGIVFNYGWFTTMQGVSFLFLTVSWALETLGVWYAYMWHMSGFMERNYGNTKFGRGTIGDPVND